LRDQRSSGLRFLLDLPDLRFRLAQLSFQSLWVHAR
jgi:hypothetical protein